MSAYEAMGLLAAGFVVLATLGGAMCTAYFSSSEESPPGWSFVTSALIVGASACAFELAQWVAYLLTTGGCK